LGYEVLNESLKWLRLKLRNRNNPPYDNDNTQVKNEEMSFEMDNPQPSL
jgi:hypothetical protein